MSGKESERIICVLGREIRIHICDTGAGLDILIEGGDKGHIGAVAVSGPGQEMQIITFPGHREDIICRSWAERLSKGYPGPVVVSAGVHYDGISKKEIGEILEALDRELEAAAGKENVPV